MRHRTIISEELKDDREFHVEGINLDAVYDEVAAEWSRNLPQVRDDLITWPLIVSWVREFAAGGVVLDLGCGTGDVCRLISQNVRQVIGVDISKRMLSEAEKRSGDQRNIMYLHADMMNISAHIAKESVDAVLSIFGVCCLRNRAELRKTFDEAYFVLRPGGKLVMQIPHPLEPFLQSKSKWVKDLETPKNYFEEGVTIRRKLRRADGKWMTAGRHHFAMASYIDELLRSNFELTEFAEPIPSKELLTKYQDLRHETEFPSSVLLIAEKSSS
jgi:ubiquinone/menaquinone biosynthesis C-methylase UbiE